MAISNIVCRGFGSFGGGIYKVPTRGYASSITPYQSQTIRAQSIFSGAIAAQSFSNTIQAQAISSGAIKTQY